MKSYVLSSGSKGNCTLVCCKTCNILIDVGISYNDLVHKLDEIKYKPCDIDYVFITHEHTDHINGLRVFLNHNKPYVYVSEKISNILFGDTKQENVIYLSNHIDVSGVCITCMALSHDSASIHGFVIEDNSSSLVYLTDTGYIHMKYYKYLINRNYYIIESNHDIEMLLNGRYPSYLKQRILSDKGHISNTMCGNYLSEFIGSDTKEVILAHLSEENNTPDKAIETVNNVLVNNGVTFNNIKCANQKIIVEVK
ncbi:MAG: MBL fold metallo-hydrolase [Bacilli bacterium]